MPDDKTIIPQEQKPPKDKDIVKYVLFVIIALVAMATFVTAGYFAGQSTKPSIPEKPDDPGIELPEKMSLEDQLLAQSNIKKFDNYDELKEFLESGPSGDFGYGFADYMRSSVDMMAMEEMSMDADLNVGMAPQAAKNGLGGEAGTDFSTTNIQVEGVDEADIVKTDGKYIYAVSKNNLFIVDAFPADTADIVSKIEFKSRPQDIYINGDKLVVFGHDYNIQEYEFYDQFRRRGSYTFFKVFDISDRKSPKQVRDIDFEGNYRNSRMIGDYVYFVTDYYNFFYIEDEPILPRIIEDGKVIPNECDGVEKCIMPDVYYFDVPYPSHNYTSVNAINVVDDSEEIDGDVYMLASNQNMYVSQDNIYITYTKYISEYDLMMEVMRDIVYPKLSKKNQDRISKIEATDDFILSKSEKIQKITMFIERYVMSLTPEEQAELETESEEKMKQLYKDISKELEKTVIHKIAVDGGKLEYKTHGEVTGHVLNQFSMDEDDGYFRIATTKGRTWSRFEEEGRESYSNLYVLDQDLKVVGAVEELAKDERIYSVRFMQDRAYMVTFRQTDPLFVIDLKNPEKPKVLGKLKIPGFSNYLHPYDENFLIGIGKDTVETEWGGFRTKGLKLSLFDVSDVGDPKEVDTYVMGDAGSDSIALHDHKAFLFSKEKNLLVIPVSVRENMSDDEFRHGTLTFRGAAVFHIDEEGFELQEKIEHGKTEGTHDWWRGYSYYDNMVKRSLYIEDTLYTYSDKYLKMNNLKEDLELIKKLELKKERKPEDEDDFDVIN